MMTDIERKLRMFYVLEAKDRWEHLLIVADECEENGNTKLADALRWMYSINGFPNAVVLPKRELIFNAGAKISGTDLVAVIESRYSDHTFLSNAINNAKREG